MWKVLEKYTTLLHSLFFRELQSKLHLNKNLHVSSKEKLKPHVYNAYYYKN